MADNDIYNNQNKYQNFLKNVKHFSKPLSEYNPRSNRKYVIRDSSNVKHFKTLHKKFEAKDLSYIRRLRLFRTLLMVTEVLKMDLSKAERDDIDNVMAFANQQNKSYSSKKGFVLDIRYLWKLLFPIRDEQGYIDDTIFPYPVRHLNGKIDRSKQRQRDDRMSVGTYEKLLHGFSKDPRMQCFLSVTLESLGRPQELLMRKIKDIEIFDNYAKVYITSHGKEGTGFLRVIDSFHYLTKWLNQHPEKDNPNAWLFRSLGNSSTHDQWQPAMVNRILKRKCKELGIRQKITMYSFKRNGVTMLRLQGKSDIDIQHIARWTTTKQLHTYDMSEQEDSFKQELVKRGMIKGKGKYKEFEPHVRICMFCKKESPIAETYCVNCNRPLDREVIEADNKAMEQRMNALEETMRSRIEEIDLSHLQPK